MYPKNIYYMKKRGLKYRMMINAKNSDYERIVEFYKYVIDHTENMSRYGRWIYGKHPTDEMIKKYVDDGYMYYETDEGKITVAVAVTPFQGEDYHPIEWGIDAKDDEVMVIHLLCVNPDKQNCGLAKRAISNIIEAARHDGKKAVRLDALSCNIPAHKLYESLGFQKCGTQNWFASNTGWIDFYLYEYIL